MKQNILVPFDGSANATEALRVAIDMAKAFNEKIVLLNVQPSYETPHTKQFFSKKQIKDYQAQMADEAMQPGVDILKKSGVGFLTKMRSGRPPRTDLRRGPGRQRGRGGMQGSTACA